MKKSPFAFVFTLIDKINVLFEERDAKQKAAIVIFVFAILVSVDVFFLVRPLIGVFTKKAPELSAQKQKLESLREDLRNRKLIEEKWAASNKKLQDLEKMFFFQEEMPAILEYLSKLAQKSKVKIITLKPGDVSEEGVSFVRFPARMSAVASTHDLGNFLSELEAGAIYFKITDLKIAANSTDDYRHTMQLEIETYAKKR